MHHNIFGKKLSRTKNERKRLFSNLIRDLILHGKIITSHAKAKAVQPKAEKLVTLAKKGKDVHRRRILQDLPDKRVVDILMTDAKDRFLKRTSGFTRIIRMGVRRSDNAEEVMLSFVDEPIVREPVKYEEKEVKRLGDKETKKKEIKKNSIKKGTKKTAVMKKRR